jgi:hypothetical protein
VTQGKPSWFVRRNMRNAVPIKRHLSQDYSVPKTTKILSKKSAQNNSNKSGVSGPVDLRLKVLAAVEHWASHGDHTGMARLVQEATSPRNRNALIIWFERVCGLKWDKLSWRFRGKGQDRSKAMEQANLTPLEPSRDLSSSATSPRWAKLRTSITPTCAVCGHPAMPGEDTCYHHHSG